MRPRIIRAEAVPVNSSSFSPNEKIESIGRIASANESSPDWRGTRVRTSIVVAGGGHAQRNAEGEFTRTGRAIVKFSDDGSIRTIRTMETLNVRTNVR